jgi:hypothetical protein
MEWLAATSLTIEVMRTSRWGRQLNKNQIDAIGIRGKHYSFMASKVDIATV